MCKYVKNITIKRDMDCSLRNAQAGRAQQQKTLPPQYGFAVDRGPVLDVVVSTSLRCSKPLAVIPMQYVGSAKDADATLHLSDGYGQHGESTVTV